jgi:hypothetical protein
LGVIYNLQWEEASALLVDFVDMEHIFGTCQIIQTLKHPPDMQKFVDEYIHSTLRKLNIHPNSRIITFAPLMRGG